MTKNILVLIPVEERHKSYLNSCYPEGSFIYSSHNSVTKDDVAKSQIIIGNVPHELLKFAHNLQWLQLESAGTGIYTEKGILPENIVLTNASGAFGLAISEYMIGAMLMLFKNFHLYRDNQTNSIWKFAGNVKSIKGSVIVIAGLGDIGSEFAKRVKMLGAYTIGIKRTTGIKPDFVDELYTLDKLTSILPRADVLALCLPDTPKTRKIIDKNTLGIMKESAVVLNVGRGSAIDTDDLCDALENKIISGAALDVTDPEPLPTDHKLWKMQNAIITPHVSGGYSLNHTHDSIVNICGENLKLFFKGEVLNNIVSFIEGY